MLRQDECVFEGMSVSMLCEFGLNMLINAPFGGVFEVKCGKRKPLAVLSPRRNAVTWDWRPMNYKQRENRFCGLVSRDVNKNWSHRKRRSGQSNWTKRSHRRRTQTVQPYLPGYANGYTHQNRASLGSPKFITQTASRSVQPFCRAQLTTVTDRSTDVVLGL